MQKNRKNILTIIMICVAFFTIEPVFAADCNALLTPGAYQLLQDALNIIRIMVPVLLIILCSLDLGIAVVSDDKDALKKSGSKIVKRFLAAIAIFFIPLIVNTLIGLVESAGVDIVDDPMCGLQ